MLTKADLAAIGQLIDERLDARLDALFSVFESKIEAHLGARFSAFESRLDAHLDTQFSIFESKLDIRLDTRLAAFEAKLETRLDTRLAAFEAKIETSLDARFTAFEARIDSKIEALAIMTKNGFDRIHTELNEFKEEMYAFKRKTEQSFYEIECRFNAIEVRLTRLETSGESSNQKIDSLVSLYRNHDGRLVKLERSVFPAGA